MQEKTFVSELKDGMAIDSTFAVTEKDLLDFKSKPGRYLQLKLRDKSGEIWAKCWEEAELVGSMVDVGDVIRISGDVVSYNGHIQLKFDSQGISREEDYDISHFIDSTSANVDSLYSQLLTLAKGYSNKHLKALLLSFLDDSDFESSFKTSPCAKSHHHNYLGGLLEHTFSVVVICRTMAKLYPSLDKELLLTGAILHDFGKTRSYKVDVLIDLSAEGGLYDHVVLSYEMARDAIRDIDGFPKDLERKLLHMILSHHGKKEWGAPVLPMIEEACVLSYADLLDSQTSEFINVKEQASLNRNGMWSGYSRKLERFLYFGDADEL